MNQSKEFKEDALKLSDEIGVKKAAAQLGLKYYTLAGFRSKRKEQLNAPRPSDAEQQSRIREPERENAELRRSNDILKDVLVFRKRPEEVKTCERHLFILERKGIYAVNEMCIVLKISGSGYYRWMKNCSKPTKQQLLLIEINRITRNELGAVIFRYVFGYYNTIRVTCFNPESCRRWFTGRCICRRKLRLDDGN